MARHTDALASIYARSIFGLAQNAGGPDKIVEIGEELEQICEIARSNATFREFLASPIIDKGRRSQALRGIFANRVTDLTLRFLLVLNEKERLYHLEAINTGYDALVQESFGRIEVDVITPSAVDAATLDAITKQVQATMGKTPVVHTYTDPSMLGGMKLRMGDQMIDGSVASRLRRLKQNLLGHGGAAVRARLSDIVESGTA